MWGSGSSPPWSLMAYVQAHIALDCLCAHMQNVQPCNSRVVIMQVSQEEKQAYSINQGHSALH